jgi:hypothetical protein
MIIEMHITSISITPVSSVHEHEIVIKICDYFFSS